MKKILYFILVLQTTATLAQVGIGEKLPKATLDITNINNDPNLVIIKNNEQTNLHITNTGIGVKQLNPTDKLEINLDHNVETKINIDLNSNYISNSLRLGVNYNGEVIPSNYRIGDIIYKSTQRLSSLNSILVNNNELRVYLTPGTYLIDGLIIYSSMSSKDVLFGFDTPLNTTGYFTGVGLHGTFSTTTAAEQAIPSKYCDINNDMAIMGGEDNNAESSLTANINGIVTITTAGYITIKHKQQIDNSYDTTIYPNSFIKYERIN